MSRSQYVPRQHPTMGFSSLTVMLCLPIALLASCYILVQSRTSLQARQYKPSKPPAPLYLPETAKVRLITLGFEQFTADVLWFNTLNYFGRQLQAQADYRWLGHMCELVTDLDPRSRPVAEFCATMLSWVARQPESSTKLLRKAISIDPTYWRYHYLLGFNYWYFHEDKGRAKSILTEAAKLPDAPTFIASLAASITADEENPAIALRFLQELRSQTKDPNAAKALDEKIVLAVISRDIAVLESLIANFESARNEQVTSFEQLIVSGQLREIPKDPFGKPYLLDPEKRTIRSKRGGDGLKFKGRTATTGLARFEKRFE